VSYLQEQIDIDSLFATQWAAGPNTPIEWDNSDFDPSNAQEAYVSVVVQGISARQVELGKATNNYRHFGDIVVMVFTPVDQGGAAAKTLADAAANIFRSKFIGSGIVTRSPNVSRVGRIGSWFQVNVTTRFHRDTVF
jgi:hypothetical protein